MRVRQSAPTRIRFVGIEPLAGANYTALQATLEAQRGDGEPFRLHPQSRQFSDPVTETNEAAIATRLDGQLYLVVGKQDDDGRWQLRLVVETDGDADLAGRCDDRRGRSLVAPWSRQPGQGAIDQEVPTHDPLASLASADGAS